MPAWQFDGKLHGSSPAVLMYIYNTAAYRVEHIYKTHEKQWWDAWWLHGLGLISVVLHSSCMMLQGNCIIAWSDCCTASTCGSMAAEWSEHGGNMVGTWVGT
jgi:hypothetical protein